MNDLPTSPQEQLLLAQKYLDEAANFNNQLNFEQELLILEKANALILPKGEASDIIQANIWYKLGKAYSSAQDYSSALSFNQQALDLRTKIFGALAEPTLEAAVGRGLIFSEMNRINKALDYLFQILNKYKATPPSSSLHYGILYNEIGACYLLMGDYWKAILHFQKAMEIFKALEKPSNYWEGTVYHYLGESYIHVKDTKNTLDYLQKALHKFEAGKHYQMIPPIYATIGGMYSRMKEYEQAIDYYQKSLSVAKELGQELTKNLGMVYMGLGRAYSNLRMFKKAHPYLQEALAIQLKVYDFHSLRIAHTYSMIGNLCLKQKDYLSALLPLQKGLQASVPTFKEEDSYKNPSLDELKVTEHNVCIILLSVKAKIFEGYYLEVEPTIKNIHFALECAELAIGTIEQKRQSYHSDHSKLSMEGVHEVAYRVGLEIAHTAWSKTKDPNALEKAFLFAEKAKAVLLLSAMQGEIAKVKSPIPEALSQKEQHLKTQLIQLDKVIQSQKRIKEEDGSKEAMLQNLQVDFLAYDSQYSQLMQELEQNYPDYYQIKYQTEAISIAKIQPLLHSKELLLQYSLYNNQLFIFAIDNQSVFMEKVNLPSDFIQQVTTFQKTIFLGDLEEYISLTLQFYSVLFQPIEHQLEGKEKLLIIPDGALHSLPFDALISPIADESSIENFSQLPYLLQRFQVQYHYSATLIGQSHFKQQLDLRHKIQDGFFGVAPVKFGKLTTGSSGYILKSQGDRREIILKSGDNEAEALVDLEATETEVKKVYELFEKQGKEAIALFYDMASKEQLLEYIEDYKHILLSTHGFADKENSALSGLNLYVESTNSSNDENSNLYISDVLNLQLKAELVVLSSCESGVGKLQTGEGMMALHRAFLYAGAQNIVYSLFKVPQDSTSELVQTFFRYVLEGENYSRALRKAKLELVNNEAFEPIDWAGFALIGG